VGVPSTDNGLESVNGVIKKLHTLGELLSVSTYLPNAMKMMSNWSKDRILETNSRISSVTEKNFFDTPDQGDGMLLWKYLYADKPTIHQIMPVKNNQYVMTKHDHLALINLDFAKKKYSKLHDDFNAFIKRVQKINVVDLNTQKWEESKCTCSWHMKNYTCYQITALAVNKSLVCIPPQY
jgi:hypothetical protein